MNAYQLKRREQIAAHKQEKIFRAEIKAQNTSQELYPELTQWIQENKRYSKAEKNFKESAEQKGWTVLQHGWPDYLIIKDDKIAFVEVKDGRDKLRDNQRKILDVLTTAGLKCFVWTPANGFQKYIKSPVR